MLLVVDHYGTAASYGVLHTISSCMSSSCQSIHISLLFMVFGLLVCRMCETVEEL